MGAKDEEFRRALTPRFVQSTRIIALALGGGVAVMLVLAVTLAYAPRSASAEQDPFAAARVLFVCSLVHAVIAATTFGLAVVLPRLVWTRMHARRRTDAGGRALTAVRAVLVLRLVLCEAAATFGLIVCILGATLGVLRTHPLYWLNACSALILIVFIVLTFPDEERLVALYQRLIAERM
jgi:hypothetical protein